MADKLKPDNSFVNSALRMRMTIPGLNATEQRLANTIIDLGPSLQDFSVAKVARKAAVSPAMIVKLAKKLGFSGFLNLKTTLLQYTRSPLGRLHNEIAAEDDAMTSISKVFSTATQALQETLALVDVEQFERAAKVFERARQRLLCGAGGSGIIALDAAHKFLRIGVNCNAQTDAHLMKMSASLLKKGDIVVGISYSGQTRVIVETLQISRRVGATTIALTNFLNSPIAEVANIVLHSTSRGSTITSESVAARIAQLCLIDALFVRVAQRNYGSALANIKKTMSVSEKLRFGRLEKLKDEKDSE